MVAPLLLLAVLTLPAAAADKIPDCIHVSSTSLRYRADLDAVRACQEKARQKMIDDAAAKGKPLAYQKLEKIDDQQRAEVKAYLEKSGTVIEGSTKNGRALGGVTERDLSRVSPEEGAEIEGLQKRLHAAAGDGKDGITPAMGRDIIDSLKKKQGSISPEMQDLLDAVVRDGGKLTPETMKKIQGAARAAKGAGLELNIDKGTETNILEHDFDSDKAQKPEAPASPGNL